MNLTIAGIKGGIPTTVDNEGIATGMEEWMMHAGLFDDRPRSRELMLILVAQRAV